MPDLTADLCALPCSLKVEKLVGDHKTDVLDVILNGELKRCDSTVIHSPLNARSFAGDEGNTDPDCERADISEGDDKRCTTLGDGTSTVEVSGREFCRLCWYHAWQGVAGL
jgi:hypothetical protein